MDKLLNIVKWIFNPFFVQKTDQLKVVALCVVVATTFWFLNAFNKTYTTVFSFPIAYNYDKEKYIPLEPLKTSVEISLTGQGWDLLKEAFSVENEPILITPSKLPGIEFISARVIENRSLSLLERFQINEILTDSLKCNFDYKISKLVNLKLPLDSISLGNGYAIVSDIEVTPKQVHISGPASVLEGLRDTMRLKLHEIVEDDFDDEIALDFPQSVISALEEVNIRFDIAPYIEVTRTLPYTIVNKNSNLAFRPKKILVKAYLPEKFQKNLVDSTIKLQLDLTHFTFEKDTVLPVQIMGFPKFVKYVTVEDSSIYITKK